jgi:hypothetical protein
MYLVKREVNQLTLFRDGHSSSLSLESCVLRHDFRLHQRIKQRC